MADAHKTKITRMENAADELRLAVEEGREVSVAVLLAVADLLATEAGIRTTQPRGFYEVEDADKVAAAILGEEVI